LKRFSFRMRAPTKVHSKTTFVHVTFIMMRTMMMKVVVVVVMIMMLVNWLLGNCPLWEPIFFL